MFPLLVTEQLDFWPEKDVRQRLWVMFLYQSLLKNLAIIVKKEVSDFFAYI